ncbi:MULTISPECIES: glycosyltransferase family 4 protein [Acidithiobacillus]|uniref:glycosyltransferase family 4 protein n=1 Tax=Acidithiobacillus TaxID=119977 RepID=UPI000691104E|nr:MULTISPECIES: glycosyltransferase family 4 protein [Acidithiobacillus]MBU2740809.1 glycosyltransferase family 4 protein [Acidithiobacillus albertensis]MBU2835592.1 glycosyltransferase family 4 protein [Acidithiobacillus thiooxidans]MDA8177802.1 glycosyltransferase family 4 protein [Acidithiobacillus sp.]
MNILFVDQTAKLSGGELALLDIVTPYKDGSKVILFEDGPLRAELVKRQVKVEIIIPNGALNNIRRGSRIPMASITSLVRLARSVAQEAKNFDFIFANSQKAGLISVLAGQLASKPVVWYLHDILNSEHFGKAQLLAARYTARKSTQILVNSKSTKEALQILTGRNDNTHLIYNAFNTKPFVQTANSQENQREALGFDSRPLVGVFGRLSPWKGQDVFLRTLAMMPAVQGLIVGSPMFGEDAYAQHLEQEIKTLGLENRVKLLGFRSDIPELMKTCDIIAHTSIAPEPFGRVIVEGMLSGRPVVASKSGGPNEIIENGVTGMLYTPGDSQALQSVLSEIINEPEQALLMAQRGRETALNRFSLDNMHKRLDDIITVCFNQQKTTLCGESV